MTEDAILRATSRSFYLTLRFLPRAVREEIGLAYLLARASDTIADTSAAAPEQRLALLRAVHDSREQPVIAGYVPEEWVKHQRDPAERALLSAWPELWTRLHRTDAAVRPLLIDVLGHIIEGQMFDLQRFGAEQAPLSDEEMDRYTWLVAGCVGEFWTELCLRRLDRFSNEPADLMRRRARHYGQALQLVNILRDRPMDAALGRVYLAESAVPRWTGQARVWLQEGADYCAVLRSGRLRYATLLPALLGWRTLALAAEHPPGLLTPPKVSRRELRQWMRRALSVWLSAAAVPRLARAAAAG
jgi:farnesyl-diphosphate farnesyltransferase